MKTLSTTTWSQHSQECNDPCQYCFCDLWLPDPKNGLPGLVEHLYVRFGDRFWDQAEKRTDTQTPV